MIQSALQDLELGPWSCLEVTIEFADGWLLLYTSIVFSTCYSSYKEQFTVSKRAMTQGKLIIYMIKKKNANPFEVGMNKMSVLPTHNTIPLWHDY